MLVIIEGLDRIGKSTQVKNLVDNHGFASMHFTKPVGKTDSERAYYQMGTFDRMFAFAQALDKQKCRVVTDRGHLGEMVYGPLYRADSNVDTSYIFDLEKNYGPFDNTCLILLVHNDLDVLKARDDGLGFGVEKLSEEQDIFISSFQKSNISKKIIIDVTDLSIDWVSTKVEEYLSLA